MHILASYNIHIVKLNLLSGIDIKVPFKTTLLFYNCGGGDDPVGLVRVMGLLFAAMLCYDTMVLKHIASNLYKLQSHFPAINYMCNMNICQNAWVFTCNIRRRYSNKSCTNTHTRITYIMG